MKIYSNKQKLSIFRHSSRGENRFIVEENPRLWNTCKNLLPYNAACFLPGFYKATWDAKSCSF